MAGRNLRTDDGADDGAAVVEFVMIGVLLIFLLFGVLQVAGLFYVRNVVAASAADGARYGATAGRSAADGAARANALILRTLSGPTATSITCTAGLTTDRPSGLVVTEVVCSGRMKSIFAPVGSFVDVRVVAHALKEPER